MAYGTQFLLHHHHFSAFSHQLLSCSDPPPRFSGNFPLMPVRKLSGIVSIGVTKNVHHLISEGSKNTSKVDKENEETIEVLSINKIKQDVEVIKENLQSIDVGGISISAYDTAWVALVKDINGSGAPLFPSSLEWIVNNQLLDGSWGDPQFFSVYDRLTCTLACVVALKTWNIHPEGCEKGLSFLQKNLQRINDEDPEHLLSGFEFTFTSLVRLAQKLEMDFLQDSTVLQHLNAKKEETLKRIPMEMLHDVPTPLLYSLEGIPNLDWGKLLKLQHPNGSFLCSPSSTAFAFMETQDEKCFKYLRETVERFNGGVPHTDSVDLYERLWIVDRLERLGFSRYFKSEIKECLEYVYRFWTPDGISWSSQTVEFDVDDTSMGFRMLRLHGYEVNANAIQHFERNGQFFCFVGQRSQGISDMLSLFRASQVLFPGENILEEAKDFAFKHLKKKQHLGQVVDRWIITKDLGGEVQYYLDVPWYAILPRIETRYYIEHYGGCDDVWIAKFLYRMYNVSNNLYLDFSKLDYNHCQKLHQLEWIKIQRWYEESNLRTFGLNKDILLKCYFLAMSSIFEPEREVERFAWAQTAMLIEAVSFYFNSISTEERNTFRLDFNNSVNHTNNRGLCSKINRSPLVDAIHKTLGNISLKVQEAHGEEVYRNLKYGWKTWLMNLKDNEEKQVIPRDEAGLLVFTINLCAGYISPTALADQYEYIHLTNLTNYICNYLRQHPNFKAGRESCTEETAISLPTKFIDLEMQELFKIVIQRNNRMDQDIKQTYFTIAKSYYYTAYCDPATIDLHITKVLFNKVN